MVHGISSAIELVAPKGQNWPAKT